MLKEINTLKPFFEDNYIRIGVREFSRLLKISPPTASKFLENYHKNGFLLKEKDKMYIYYHANKQNTDFIELSRIYFRKKLKKLIGMINKEYYNPIIILFGSLSKAEVRPDSDIDIAIFSNSKKELKYDDIEKELGRSVQLFNFKNRESVKNLELLNNILNGYKLSGEW